MKSEDKLREMIIERFGTIKEFSRAIQLPYTTIRSILERGIFNAKLANVIIICRGLNISPEELIYTTERLKEKEPVTYQSVPSATYNTLTQEWDHATGTEEIAVSDIVLGKYAGAKDVLITRMTSESMNMMIPAGSLIGIKKETILNLVDGDFVFFAHKGQSMVKKLIKIGNQTIFRPASYDPKYTDYIIEENDDSIHILGKIIFYLVEP
ncbi:LexA family transcriptional regulator [Marinilactibacillus kalidii]|uniref:LexA family transcriptional regulator n=1 Tax=Marinilactibacillus kalidii TaxID=2820274 RepID=UPI001ABE6F83|nr:LexA family transcriptional regulator [Marinilactibacillus kalidii]